MSDPLLFVDTSEGKVGVGTGSPGAKLHVNGNVDNVGISIQNNARKYTVGVRGDTSDVFSIVDDTAAKFRVVIDSSGKVGIGTNAPTELLDIAAAPGDYDAFIRLRTGSGATSPVTECGLKLTESGDYGFQFVHSGATDLLKIRHQNSAGNVDKDDIMVWHPNGIVTTPSRPAFYAWDNISTRRNHSLGILMHNATTYNIGSHYNTSTGRFLTPVAGTYIFAAVLVHDTANALSSPIYSFYVDGANRRDIIEGTGSHYAHYEQHGVYIVNLAANQSVDIRSRSASDITFVNGDHGAYYRNCFQGALLG